MTVIDKVTLNDGTYAEIVDLDSPGSSINILYHQLILVLADGSAFSVGSDITGDGTAGNDGIGVVRQKIDANTVVVDLTSGTFVAGNGVDDANPFVADVTTITSATKALKMKRVGAPTGDDTLGTYL